MATEKLLKEIEEEESLTSVPMEDFFETSISDYNEFDKSAWEKGHGFKCPKFPMFDKYMEGLESGLFMFAGESNSGKSALLMNLMIDFCTHADNNLFGIYYSLDDSMKEIVPRLIAMHESIPISVGSKPRRYDTIVQLGLEGAVEAEEYMRKRDEGIEWLKSINEQFKLKDGNSIKNGEQLKKSIENAIMYLDANYPGKKLMIGIDAMSDVRFSKGNFRSDKEKNDFIAKEVKNWTVEYDIPILGSLHLRKIEQNRRPTIADVKESGEYAYEASFLGVVYNDVGRNKQSASIYFSDKDDPSIKMPIIELDWAKNKKSSYKGKTYHYFTPNYSLVRECGEEATSRYDALIYTN